MQRDQSIGDVWEAVGPATRYQPMPLSQPSPALLGTDFCPHPTTLAGGSDTEMQASAENFTPEDGHLRDTPTSAASGVKFSAKGGVLVLD